MAPHNSRTAVLARPVKEGSGKLMVNGTIYHPKDEKLSDRLVGTTLFMVLRDRLTGFPVQSILIKAAGKSRLVDEVTPSDKTGKSGGTKAEPCWPNPKGCRFAVLFNAIPGRKYTLSIETAATAAEPIENLSRYRKDIWFYKGDIGDGSIGFTHSWPDAEELTINEVTNLLERTIAFHVDA